MKNLILALGLLVSSLASAQSSEVKTLKGYVNVDRRGTPSFLAVDPQKYELVAIYALYHFFSDDQAQTMMDCMKVKTTHVIFVDSVPDTQEAPTSIPGRLVTTHFPRLTNVRCVPAPGFIETWRDIVKQTYR